MSRLTDLLRQARMVDPQLGKDLEAEFGALMKRRTFGLVFEQHQPEAVELPGRAVRRGDKVRVLPPRGAKSRGDKRLWRVSRIEVVDGASTAHLVELDAEEPERLTAPIEDLVVVAEFRDRIYPGLVETGRVERGGDKPYHTVINAENFHALEMLTYTHRNTVDVIYIDPPYNTGARDWKYNNDYVEADDDYRHSKWLAFMERRLKIARELLNPIESVLIVTIDEKEVHRLGLLLEQVFPEARIQMVSITISPRGANRDTGFSRIDEYAYYVFFGSASIGAVPRFGAGEEEIRWQYLRRTQKTLVRTSRPNQFYPIYVDPRTSRIVEVGQPMRPEEPLDSVPVVENAVPVFPIDPDGLQLIWGLTPSTLRDVIKKGYVRVTPGNEHQPYAIAYLSTANIARAESGDGLFIKGERPDGSKIVVIPGGKPERLTTVWREPRHDAGAYGTTLLRAILPGRAFPFPKSLYAVEDTLRALVINKPDAVILDFFSGSGTTAHALMRLNRQDGGRRQCISVTNNEVSAEEQKQLLSEGLRPGDSKWEALGICDHITKPRIVAAISGKTPHGKPINGDYRFVDEFPMSEGFQENAAFFTLTYESPLSVQHNRAFERIAPMLWLRAGSVGRIITDLGTRGWDIAENYAVLENLDQSDAFVEAVKQADHLRVAFIVTDDDSAFQMVCRDLPQGVDPVRLYESYLQNFEINMGRSL